MLGLETRNSHEVFGWHNSLKTLVLLYMKIRKVFYILSQWDLLSSSFDFFGFFVRVLLPYT